MSTGSTQHKFVKFYYAKLYRNIRLYIAFHLRLVAVNITHKTEMRIKADNLIITEIAVAFIIAMTYIKHLLYIRCVLWYLTQISE